MTTQTKLHHTAWRVARRVLVGGLLVAGFFSAAPTLADQMNSDSYIIQFGNFNTTSGTKTSSSFNLTDTVGQTGAGAFGPGSSYFVGAGFQYIYQIGEFSFSISNLSVPFGELAIGVPSTASNILTVSARGAGGYIVYAYEVNPLRHSSQSFDIPDTTCDSGTCDETDAEVWALNTTYGFGFNIDGDDTPADFVDTTYFRQFANDEGAEAMQAVMSNNASVSNRNATVTYKVNVDAQQEAGDYQTSIIYVAVPEY